LTISPGEALPDVQVMRATPDGPVPAKTGELLGNGTVVLFSVPGAFTPSCTDYHLPGFLVHADELRAKGADTVACVAVNDAFVMSAWGKASNVGDEIVLLADGNGDFTRAMGLELDGTASGLGKRSQRYAAIVRDGVVQTLDVESNPGEVTVSSAEAVLEKL